MFATEPEAIASCTRCQEAVPEATLQACGICRRLFCQRCAVAGYGRVFCSTSCRDVFFYGDEDLEDTEP